VQHARAYSQRGHRRVLVAGVFRTLSSSVIVRSSGPHILSVTVRIVFSPDPLSVASGVSLLRNATR
jgi:hypothetical protein